jgi:DNA invertase Pin-like site-specific DNA recombinase
MSAAKDRRVAIYCRVSTSSQSVDPQESALRDYAERRDWTEVKVYSDRAISGAKDRRPALDNLMQDCRRGRVNTVLVWKFDRFGRSVRHLIEALEEFRQLKIDFISVTEAVDTSTPAGRLFFSMIAVFANFERDIIAERVRLGLAESKRKGTRLGRPPKKVLTPEQVEAVRKDRAKRRMPLRDLARKYGISVWSAYSICGESRV